MPDYSGQLAQTRLNAKDGDQNETAKTSGGSGAWPLYFGFAAFADLLTFVPVVGSFVGPAAIFILALAMSVSGAGAKISPTQKILFTVFAPLMELIPIVNWLPTVMAYTFRWYISGKK
jgi:hypothetical protein